MLRAPGRSTLGASHTQALLWRNPTETPHLWKDRRYCLPRGDWRQPPEQVADCGPSWWLQWTPGRGGGSCKPESEESRKECVFVNLWPCTPSGQPHPHSQGWGSSRAAGEPPRADELCPSCSHRVVQGPHSSLVQGFGEREASAGGAVLTPRGWAGRPPSSCRRPPRDTYAEPQTEDWKCAITERRREATSLETLSIVSGP